MGPATAIKENSAVHSRMFKSEGFGSENTWWLNSREFLDLLRGLGAVTVQLLLFSAPWSTKNSIHERRECCHGW